MSNPISSSIQHEISFVPRLESNERRNFGFQTTHHHQMRPKPAIEIYRPPSRIKFANSNYIPEVTYSFTDIRSDETSHNKLNVNAPEFTINRELQGLFFTPNTRFIQHSRSNGNIQQQIQLAAVRRETAHIVTTPSPQPVLPAQSTSTFVESRSQIKSATKANQNVSVLFANIRQFFR